MDEKTFGERASRLEEIGKVINKLPSEIRLEAFSLLKGYVATNLATAGDGGKVEAGSENDGDIDGMGDGGLFSEHNHEKPFENVYLVTAHLFQQHGSEPFTVAEIEAVAADAGITVPDRVDMTLRSAKDDGKNLYISPERGKFKPTVHGELYLKRVYKVKKGNKPRSKVNA